MSEENLPCNDDDWMAASVKQVQEDLQQDFEWFYSKMSHPQAVRAAWDYRLRGFLLMRKQEHEMIEREWQRRVGTTFPGWERADLYALANWASIPGSEVVKLSARELYKLAMEAVAGPLRQSISNAIDQQSTPASDASGTIKEVSNGDYIKSTEVDSSFQPVRALGEQIRSAMVPRTVNSIANEQSQFKSLEALLSDDHSEIIQVVESDDSTDEKMRQICKLDRRFLEYPSPRWANLLTVSDAAIRKTRFWKEDRDRAMAAERASRE